MAKAEQIPGLFCSLSAGSFAQSSLGHSSAEMPRVTLSCLFVWAASQTASSRNNGILSFVHAGKIKCDLNSLLDLHHMSPPGHELSGSRGGAALPSTGRTFPARAAQALRWDIAPASSDHLLPEGCLGCLPQKRLVASVLLLPPLVVRVRGMGHPPLRAQVCNSSTCTPNCSPASQGNLGVSHKTHWTQATLMSSALGQHQDHKGLLDELQEECSALSKCKVCLAKRLEVASRSSMFPPLG